MHDGNDACSLTYTWLSDGTPVSATLGEGNLPGRLYNGSFVFVTDSTRIDIAESVAWDEGRIFFLDTDTTDCWYAGDHLGNVRSVIDISRGQAVPQVLEQSDYLPYGTRINNTAFASMSGENRWRYAGKEEQRLRFFVTDSFSPDGGYNRSLDLGLLNFGARMYDPFTARWTAVDPLASKSLSLGSFVYCRNNPICLFDPYGETDYVLSENGRFIIIPTYDPYDRLIANNDYLIIKDQTIMNGMSTVEIDKREISFTVSDSDELMSVFFFLANNTNVEWVVHSFDNNKSVLGTTFMNSNSGSVDDYLVAAKESGIDSLSDATEVKKIHSHPNVQEDQVKELDSMGYPPSGFYYSDYNNYKRQYETLGKRTPISEVYFPNSNHIYRLSVSKPFLSRIKR